MSNMTNSNRAKNLKNKYRKKKRQKKLNVALIIALGAIIVVLTILIVVVWTKNENKETNLNTDSYNVETFIPHNLSGTGLIGKWRYSENTTFYFGESGKGEYSTNGATYLFSYSINDDILSIDFNEEKVSDISYKITFAEGETEVNINTLDKNGTPANESYKLVKE